MTRKQAVAAMECGAFVKGHCTNRNMSHVQGLKIERVNAASVTARKGRENGVEIPLDRLQLDETENQQRGIRLPSEFNEGPDPVTFAIINTIEMNGFCGSDKGWSAMESKWKHFPDRKVAQDERQRLIHNGLKGVEVLEFSAAVDRINRLMESEPPSHEKPMSQAAVEDMEFDFDIPAAVLTELSNITNEYQRMKREIESDKALAAARENDEAAARRDVEKIRRRITEGEQKIRLLKAKSQGLGRYFRHPA